MYTSYIPPRVRRNFLASIALDGNTRKRSVLYTSPPVSALQHVAARHTVTRLALLAATRFAVHVRAAFEACR